MRPGLNRAASMAHDDIAGPTPLPTDIADALARAATRLPGSPPVFYYASVASTNDTAARLAERGAADGTAVVGELQTAGRGRLGRSWYSPPGAGLYVSVVFRPTASAALLPPMITLAAGVALADAVRVCTHLPVEIKWPNDLVIGRRKLAGILTEAPGAERLAYAIVGFGINLRPAAYPPDIGDRATSIESELGRPIERGPLLAECLASLAAWHDALRAGRGASILERWRALAPSCQGTTVEWTARHGTATGVTSGIDEDGALLVRTSGGTERIIAGEIRWMT